MNEGAGTKADAPAGRGDGHGATVDDCWNRIGIRGDRSCPELATHVHCRNCPVHAAAASAMLDRYDRVAVDDEILHEADDPAAPAPDGGTERRILVFRIGGEWLALPSRCILEVTPVAAVHRLPHRHGGAVLGVTNVRGTLAACISVAGFLDIRAEPDPASDRRAIPMMLILDGPGGALVVPVDEVDGIHSVPPQAIRGTSREEAHPVGRFAGAVLQWQQRSITILDDATLLPALAGSLA